MNIEKKIIAVIFLLLAAFSVSAQKGLNINAVFEEYGKQKGSILIELGKDVLDGHTRIDRYKSLIVPSDSEILETTQEAIRKDANKGSILLESKKDGKIETAYYCLEKKENSDYYEYILFTNKSKKMTVIYVRGKFSPSHLEDELNKLKGLFIKVNNKRIKL
ncbi:MAG: DUF6108 family protein [Bacteroidales bacterium]|nr:DUF6108 family protein [Bacteroidales bacterium]